MPRSRTYMCIPAPSHRVHLRVGTRLSRSEQIYQPSSSISSSNLQVLSYMPSIDRCILHQSLHQTHLELEVEASSLEEMEENL